MESLERTLVPEGAKYLFLRPGIVHLITHAEGTQVYLTIILWIILFTRWTIRGRDAARACITDPYG